MSFANFRMKMIEKLLLACKKKPKKNAAPLNSIDFKRIVVISNKLLGDFLFCTPAIASLKEKYPGAEIMAVLSGKNRNIVGECDYIQHVVYMENNLSSVIKALPEIRKFKPELAVIFHSRTPYDIVAATFAGCRYIVKHYFNNDVKKLIPLCDISVIDETSTPVINHLSLVKALGCDTHDKKMFFPCPVECIKNDSQLNIGFQPGASKSNRFLPTSLTSPLVAELLKRFPDCQIHLFGAPHETALGDAFIAPLSEEQAARVVNHIGKTTLPQLAHQLKVLDLLITPDTGTLHVATALQVKTVSLFVQRRSNGCEPVQDLHLHRILYAADFNALALDRRYPTPLAFIPCEQVLEKVTELIDDSGNRALVTPSNTHHLA